MTSRLRKTQILQGPVSCGQSHIGKHSGGWANAGGTYHHRVTLDKSHPGYREEAGTRHYHLKRNESVCATVNLHKLRTFISEETWVKAAKNQSGTAPNADVV
nr:60S ribosomal protein L27a-like [Vulpes vulpes]